MNKADKVLTSIRQAIDSASRLMKSKRRRSRGQIHTAPGFVSAHQTTESLEHRLLLTDPTHTFYPDFIGPQEGALFGQRVAINEDYRVVAATGALLDNTERRETETRRTGLVYVYDNQDNLLHTLSADAQGGGFGASIAIHGNTIAVGHTGLNVPSGNQSGQVLLFDAASGEQITTLENPNPGFLAHFGQALAVNGNFIAVGHRGRVSVFNMNGDYLHTVSNPAGGSEFSFGSSVALHGSTFVTGAIGDASDGFNAGRAYSFELSTGELVQTFTNPTASNSDSFGGSVAIEGDLVVVGAPDDDSARTNLGTAYAFDANTGALRFRVDQPSPTTNQQRFGSALSLQDGKLLVGGFEDSSGPNMTGQVYLFDSTSGQLLTSFENPAITSGAYGTAVAIDGNTVIVGAPRDDLGSSDAGQVHTYSADSGDYVSTLRNQTLPRMDLFGTSVALSDRYAVIGIPQDDGEFQNSGKIRLIDLDAEDGPSHRLLSDASPARIEAFGETVAISGSVVAATATGSGVVRVFDASIAFDDEDDRSPLIASFQNPTPTVNERFGAALAVQGKHVIVGSPGADDVSQNNGQVFVFDSENPSAPPVLLNDFTVTASGHQSAFGSSVAASADAIVVGAPGDDTDDVSAGRVYVFDSVSDGAPVALSHPDPGRDDRFGTTVATFGDLVIVGTPGDNVGTHNNDRGVGSVHVFQTDGTFVRSLAIPAEDRRRSMAFGLTVSLWNDIAVVGSAYHEGAADRIGRAYVYNARTGQLLDTIENPTNESFSDFTLSLSVYNNRLLVGSPHDDLRGEQQGAAYLFDVNRRPTAITLSDEAINENIAAGSVVKTLSSVDDDSWDTHAYELVSGVGDTHNDIFEIDGDQLKINVSPDFEQQSSYNIRLRTTDWAGLSFEHPFLLSLTDVNEAPTDLQLSAVQLEVPENQLGGFRVSGITGSDPDADENLIAGFFGGSFGTGLHNSFFSINDSELVTADSLDFESTNSLNVHLQVTDKGGLTFNRAFVIDVVDVNEPPVNLRLSGSEIQENADTGTVVGNFLAEDPEDDAVTFSLVAGAGDTDNGFFEIDGTTLKSSAVFNFEDRHEFSVRVRAQDTDGMVSEQVLAIAVTDVNEAPTAIAIDNEEVFEQMPVDTLVGSFATEDVDQGNSFSYSLVTGENSGDNASFRIDGSRLVTASVLDLTDVSVRRIRVRSTDQGGESTETAFEITVTEAGELVVTESSGGTEISESGTTDSIQVGLTRQPLEEVVLAVSVSDDSVVEQSLDSLRFTPENWNQPQTISLSAVDNEFVDGLRTAEIDIAVAEDETSPEFRSASAQTITVSVRDDDEPGFSLNQLPARIAEQGGSASFEVVLNKAPFGDVVLDVAVDPETEVNADVESLTFTSENWNVPQQVSLESIDDVIVDGEQTVRISVQPNPELTDDAFDSLLTQTFDVVSGDNDTAGFSVSRTSLTVGEAGLTAAFNVRLDAAPRQNVTIAVSEVTSGQLAFSSETLIFTTDNWDVPQEVTVSAVDDEQAEVSVNTSLTLTVVDADSDAFFSELADQSIATQVLDNDSGLLGPVGRIVDVRPAFSWTPVENARTYELWLQTIGGSGDPVISRSVTATQFQSPENLPIGRYRMWIRGNLNGGGTSDWFSGTFEVDRRAEVSSTADTDRRRPTFSWPEVPGAEQYRVYISNVTSGDDAIIDEVTSQNSFTLSNPLRFGRHRVWVQAIGPGNFAATWSEVHDYYFGPQPVSAVQSTFATRPEFRWTADEDVISYHLYISRGSEVLVNQSEFTGTSFSPPEDFEPGLYRWWIRPRHRSGQVGNWSDRGDLFVGGAPQIEATTASTPGLITATWGQVEGAGSYEVYLYSDTRGRLIHRQGDIEDLSFNFDPLVPGEYRLWVKSYRTDGSSGRWSRSHALTVRSPDSPDSATPTSRLAVTFESRPTFSWQSNSTETFDLYLTDGTNRRLMESVSGRSWTPDDDLSPGEWSWYVRARHSSGQVGPWSEKATVDTTGRAVILFPKENSSGLLPMFEWTAVSGASRYSVQLDEITSGEDAIIRDDAVATSSFIPSISLSDGEYRIWVRAIGESGQLGPWSRRLIFRIATS